MEGFFKDQKQTQSSNLGSGAPARLDSSKQVRLFLTIPRDSVFARGTAQGSGARKKKTSSSIKLGPWKAPPSVNKK